MAGFYGSIDLTKLGQIVKQHPELVKVANMKDGSQHKFLNINIDEKQQVDQYGNSAYLKVSCKKDEQKQGLNYYLCDLKTSKYGDNNQQQAQQPVQQPQNNSNDDLPF